MCGVQPKRVPLKAHQVSTFYRHPSFFTRAWLFATGALSLFTLGRVHRFPPYGEGGPADNSTLPSTT